jgi:hypothetical protein
MYSWGRTGLAGRQPELLAVWASLQVIAGLDWVGQHAERPAVVVMSLGGSVQAALDLAVHNLVLAGIPVVVAAGNGDVDACEESPAR